MKKIILILIGLCIIIGIGVAAFILLSSSQAPAPQTTITNSPSDEGNNTVSVSNPGNSSSQATTSGTAFSIQTNGGSMQVRDFTKDPTTVKDANDSGWYLLNPPAYYQGKYYSIPTTTNPYIIVFDPAYQSFTIALLVEPIAQARTQAEQYLMSELGISQTQMCQLNYTITVTTGVNPYYAGQNLGFSFCPGATALQ